jgi:DnaJ-class molecular chaperone
LSYGKISVAQSALKTLGLASNHTHSKKEIKLRFRELAKIYHPDLQHHASHEQTKDVGSTSEDQPTVNMSDLIEAYTVLMDDNIEAALDSKVGLACEIYTIAELRNSDLYEVK